MIDSFLHYTYMAAYLRCNSSLLHPEKSNQERNTTCTKTAEVVTKLQSRSSRIHYSRPLPIPKKRPIKTLPPPPRTRGAISSQLLSLSIQSPRFPPVFSATSRRSGPVCAVNSSESASYPSSSSSTRQSRLAWRGSLYLPPV